MDDLGSYFQDTPAEDPNQPKKTWQDLVNDPVGRSALLAFGVRAMSGGWGNPLQQTAGAIGAGAEAAGHTADSMRAEAIRQGKDAEATKQAELERTNKRDVAQISSDARMAAAQSHADSRVTAAELRAAASERNAALRAGAKNANEETLYQRDIKQYVDASKANLGNLRVPEEEILAKATEYAIQQMHKRRAVVRMPDREPPAGAPGPAAGAPPVSSPVSPPSAAPGSPALSPPAAVRPSSAAPPAASRLPLASSVSPITGIDENVYRQAIAQPEVKAALNDPAAWQRLVESRPQHRRTLEAIKRRYDAGSTIEPVGVPGF